MSAEVSHAYGLMGCALLILATVSFWLRLFVRSDFARRGTLGVIFMLSWIPLPRTSMVQVLRGVVGDIAIPTFLLFGLMVGGCLLSSLPKHSSAGQKLRPDFFVPDDSLRWFFILVVGAGSLFYPMTMGFTIMDPYAWGYAPNVMLLVCLSVILALEFAGQRTAAVLILLAVAAYAAGLMESSNLWDYLMDPLLFGISLSVICRGIAEQVRSRRRVPASRG